MSIEKTIKYNQKHFDQFKDKKEKYKHASEMT